MKVTSRILCYRVEVACETEYAVTMEGYTSNLQGMGCDMIDMKYNNPQGMGCDEDTFIPDHFLGKL